MMFLIRNAFKRRHYPVDIIVQCVRGYLTYVLSLRNLEEMRAERGIFVDHATSLGVTFGTPAQQGFPETQKACWLPMANG
ncbi:protein of unknown function [Xenorhabdus bovienii]|uniref:Transposase n=1 Tax=Xenorhabdus bovienii TaxID=40576 RepID=A0A0B6XCJ3_XENBV|nr:protein of unknown function [Xenorhabdus bovienii]